MHLGPGVDDWCMTATTTLRVHPATRDKVNALARDEFGGEPASRVIERLLADRQKIRILEAYDRLASDPEHWRDYLAELGEWEVTAGDGLAEAPPGSRP